MKTASHIFRNTSFGRHSQRGVTLIIALIMLIAMTLAGLALFRQVGTGVIVARNLTFREAALAAADQGVEAARAWLTNPAQDGRLDDADVAAGYYAAWCNVSVNPSNQPDANGDGNVDNCGTTPPPDPSFSASSYNWNNAGNAIAPDGTPVDFVIHRMCSIPGGINASGQQCVTLQTETSSPSKNELSEYQKPITGVIQPYYRITTRVIGPMNTIVYTQSIIY